MIHHRATRWGYPLWRKTEENKEIKSEKEGQQEPEKSEKEEIQENEAQFEREK